MRRFKGGATSAIKRVPFSFFPRGASVSKVLSVPLSGFLLLAVAGASPAAAQGAKARFLEQSLASQLVQAMTQRRIFEADDKADGACKDKEFLQAAVVQQPAVVRSGGIETKKWQEDWTLRRCDKTVAYRVFYSEVGQGGLTFSVASHDQLAAPQPAVVAKAEPAVLTLQKPPMRGAEVMAVQKALVAAGYKIKADGIYGPGTQKAVMQFQKAKGLEASGDVDARTREALGL